MLCQLDCMRETKFPWILRDFASRPWHVNLDYISVSLLLQTSACNCVLTIQGEAFDMLALHCALDQHAL